jgi:hypothetical protein
MINEQAAGLFPDHESAEPVALSSTSPTGHQPKLLVARRGFNLRRPVLGKKHPMGRGGDRQDLSRKKNAHFADRNGRMPQ